MGYLHFDRVKIPQENSIFNGSSSIQLSSVNDLLREHGIVLNNNANENDRKSPSHSSFPSSNDDQNTFYQSSNEVFLQQPTNHENIHLGLDDELTWNFNHNNMFVNNSDPHIRTNAPAKTSIFDINNTTFSSINSHSDSPVTVSVNNVVTKFNRKDLLDLKVHKALVDIPGFNEIKEKYQCSVHRNGKKGRGRKMKCCQTADDLFKLALKEKCQSIGIHDYSKLKRRRGRPKKSSQSSPSNVNSTVSSNSTYQSKDFVLPQGDEPAGSGSSFENIDQNANKFSVQFQLNQLQKQLNDQQLLLNEQMKSINIQRLKTAKPTNMPVMVGFEQPHNHSLNLQHKQPSQDNFANFQASFALQHNQEFGFKNENNVIKTSLLRKQSQLADINNTNFVNNPQADISSFENMLSPISLNTPNLLSPGRYSHRSSIFNLNNSLVNELLNGNVPKVVQPKSRSNIMDINEKNDDVAHEDDHMVVVVDDHHDDDGENDHFDNGHLLDDFEPKAIENKIDDITEIKPKKKYQKKTKTDTDKKLLHISGKKIEVDPITNKMKCFHEGCDAQFKKKAYLSRHMKKHLPIKDHVCPFWSEHVHTKRHTYPANFVQSSESDSNLNSLGDSLPFEAKLREHGLLGDIPDKSMNKYISTMQCHQKGFFTRKDEFMIHLKSFHVITDLEQKPDYAICVECGDEFTSLKDWYENHLNTLGCKKIINKNFNSGRALRKQYEKENRLKRSKEVEESND